MRFWLDVFVGIIGEIELCMKLFLGFFLVLDIVLAFYLLYRWLLS